MASIRDLKNIIRKYYVKQKKFHRAEVNAMWKEIYGLFKQVEKAGEVERKPETELKKKYCKYCEKWVKPEDYNLADEICIPCYNDNVDDGGETGNE